MQDSKPASRKKTQKSSSSVQVRKKDTVISKTKIRKVATPQYLLAIRRHWFGLMSFYAILAFALVAFFLFFVLLDDFSLGNHILVAIPVVAIIIAVVYAMSILINRIYWSNLITIDDTEIRQVTREALFATKYSVLGLANVEDVTAVQHGFFAHLFNYGTLTVETAGEQENFEFKYCPRPEECAKVLMQIREKYLTENPEQTLH